MALIFKNARAIRPYEKCETCHIVVTDGHFSSISSNMPTVPRAHTVDCEGMWFAPGLIDIQVNGGGGILFNDNPSFEALQIITNAHQRLGTRWLLPTLISDHLDVVDAGMRAVEQAIAAGMDSILGIHIEGPFLNPDRCGIHDPERMHILDDQAIELLSSLRYGKTLVTLAPECTHPASIRKLVESGVVVSLGHSDANYAQAMDALSAGASGFTHLYNAMSPLKSREPGLVGAALSDPNPWTSIIMDGHHINPVSAKIAFSVRPLNKFVLITDAMPAAGTDQDNFILQGKHIRIKDGSCRDHNGTLAGAYLTLPNAIANAVSMHGLPPNIAIRMASEYAADFMSFGESWNGIEIGAPANGVVLSEEFDLIGMLVNGEWTPLASSERLETIL